MGLHGLSRGRAVLRCPFPGRQAEVTLEDAAEVAVVLEPAELGDDVDRVHAGPEQGLREFDASALDRVKYRRLRFRGEQPEGQAAGAAHCGYDVGRANAVGRVAANEFEGALEANVMACHVRCRGPVDETAGAEGPAGRGAGFPGHEFVEKLRGELASGCDVEFDAGEGDRRIFADVLVSAG